MQTKVGWLIGLMIMLNSVGMAVQVASTVGADAASVLRQHAEPLAAVVGASTKSPDGELAAVAPLAPLPDLDDQDDPSYRLYKEGYKLILDEKWADARSRFSELLSKYSKSKYCADAQYWMAYSLKYSDKKKAIDAYKSFLKKYPSSNYYDDATADLGRLENPTLPVVPPPNRFIPPVRATGVTEPEVATAPTGYTVYEGAAREYALAAAGRAPGWEEKQEDPQVRMKVEAFQALVRSGKDQKTLDLVKETLLDPKQPKRMRETALYALRNFDEKARAAYAVSRDDGQSPAVREAAGKATKAYDNFDLQGFYVQVLKTDTNAWLSQNIIFQLGKYAEQGDERIIAELKRTALDGKKPREVREAALFSLRGAKRPDILELYGQVAKQDADAKIRLAAVYQIGQASRADEEAAYKLLKEYTTDRSQGREMREAALSSLRSLEGNKAAAIYLETAKSDPDERIQQMALYYFVEASKDQPEKVFVVLKEILQDRSRPWSSRETAMNQIARIGSDEAFNLLLTIAKTDPEERIRMSAVNYIGHLGKNKSKSLAALISLFQSLSKDENSTVQSLLYAIASIGNDDAVDFLGKVAKTHESFTVRQTAIQFLGSIGGEKARTILVEIMKGK